jgi:Ca2+-binding EF-hand superfamily protein
VRVLLCALLLAGACKSEKSKPAEQATPTERDETQMTSARQRPSLPPGVDPDSVKRADQPEPRNWNDPAFREELDKAREERRKRMDQMLDTNHDGVVSAEERQARLKPMYERLDANGDGKLTPDELSQSTGRMSFSDPAAIDTNKDGVISMEELDAAVTAKRDEMRARWRGRGGAALGSDEP